DRHPSLSFTVKNGRVLFHCFAGCEYGAIIEALEQRQLWPPIDIAFSEGDEGAADAQPESSPAMLRFDAELVRPRNGSAVAGYLRTRGLDVGTLNDIAQHPQAYHRDSGQWWPAVVAAVRDVDGNVRALHRAFLSYTEPPGKA